MLLLSFSILDKKKMYIKEINSALQFNHQQLTCDKFRMIAMPTI